jgi:uncharacterized protein
MNVVIAGGSGLIGRAFTAELLQNGHSVFVLTRRPGAVNLPPGAQAVAWDGATARGWESTLEQAGAVVNLAGENIGTRPWTQERKRKIRASRVKAGNALVEALRGVSHRPGVLLQISGTGYYGPQGSEPLTEKSPVGNDTLASIAVDWENATRGAEALGVRRVVMRSGVVLDSKEGILARFAYPMKMYIGGPLGSGRQWISWMHMRDQVSAMRFLMENSAAEGVYNLSAPQAVTNAEFVRTLAAVMGRPYWLPVPAFALKILLGEMSTLVLDGQRVIPKRLQALGYQFSYPELRPALENLLC